MVAGGRVPKNMLEGLGLGLLDCEGMGLVVDRVESVGKSQFDWVSCGCHLSCYHADIVALG